MNRRSIKFLGGVIIVFSLLTPTYLAADNTLMNSEISMTTSPSLEFTPTSHDFGFVEEGECYFTTFEIWNSGTGELTWNLDPTQPWITGISPNNGSSTGERDTVSVRIDTTGLSSGLYSGFIIINSNDTTSISSFGISFIVNEPPSTPTRPSGPSNGVVGTPYAYSTVSTDPEGDSISYGIDWNGDDIVDHWGSYRPSGVTYTLYLTFAAARTYYLRFKAKDEHGAQSEFSLTKIVEITGENHDPETPSTPTGPSSGDVDTSYSFTTSTIDPDGDDVKYGWDWDGDNVIDQWTGFYDSGDSVTLSHRYTSAGTYQIKVVAKDEHGAQSDFSSSKTIIITGNSAPNKPATPSGPISGRPGIPYSYSSSTTDPDGDNVYYLFDWGDGTTSGWKGPFSSGSTIIESHTWANRGTYAIRVKAKDDPNGDGDLSDGTESVFSDSLPISMPKNKNLFSREHTFLDIYQNILELFHSFRN